jgi:glycosyltransferase involved in cell wall biosynthesis
VRTAPPLGVSGGACATSVHRTGKERAGCWGGTILPRPSVQSPGGAMRVLVFSSLYPNAVMPQFGLFVHRRVEAVARRGADVRVVSPVPFFPHALPVERWRDWARVPSRERLGKISVTHPRYPHFPGPGMYVQAVAEAHACLSHLRALRRNFDFDLIDAHYVYPDGVAAVRLARALGVPCVVTARGSDINLLPRHAFVRRQISRALQQADAIVAVSGALAEAMQQLGAPADRIHVIPNGVDRTLFHYGEQAEARQKLGIYSDERMLLTVGNLTELKGHALILDAVAKLRARGIRVSYHVIGTGEEEKRLEERIQALGLDDCVHLQGSIANERLRPWYQAASLYVLASSREGWPNVLNEALACGTPVVATPVGGVPEIIRHEENGLLVERKISPLADAIERALWRDWDREALAASAAQPSWSDVADRLMALFGRLTGVRVHGVSHEDSVAETSAESIPSPSH